MDIYIKPSQDGIDPVVLQEIIDLMPDNLTKEVIEILGDNEIVFE